MNDGDTVAAVQRTIAVRLIDNHGRITPSGLNAAIRVAKGEIIVRMDAHTEYAPDYIRKCVETLDQTQADNVGGPARTKPTTFMQRAIASAYHCALVVGGASFHNEHHEGWVATVPYGCWKKSAFDRFGLFDETLVRNQDDEHNFRILIGGGRVWQSSAIRSWYAPRSSLRELAKQYFQYGYWKVRVIWKHRSPAKLRHLMPGLFLFSLLLALGLAPFSHRVAIILYIELCAYAAYLTVTSFVAVWKREWRPLWIMPLVIAMFQLPYGLGFLVGLVDKFLARGILGRHFASLSR